jgi:hypothetical protein
VTEAELFEAIRTLAHLLSWEIYHTHDSRRSAPGFPDLVLMRPPELVFIELKTQTGRLTKAQQRWQDELAACGADVAVWRPSELTSGHISRRLDRVHEPVQVTS